jgi:hypothetical protein
MNSFSPIPENISRGDQQNSSDLGQEKSPSKREMFSWWYRMTSPPRPDDLAPFEERERFRRGRTGSQISIMLYFLLLSSFPAALNDPNPALLIIVLIDLFVITLALFFNRFGWVSAAGIMVVICFMASPTTNILTTPGGLNSSSLPVFGILIVPLMCAVSFLPPWSVFVVGAINCLLIFCSLKFMPNSGDLSQMLTTAFPTVVTPLILTQGMVAGVAFIWVSGATRALKRADRAEEIVKLKEIESENQQKQLIVSKQIEEGVQQIIMTMNVVVSQNDFNIRVPLSQENILWRASKSINNMLSRLQGLKQSQEELNKTHAIAAEVARYIHEGKPIPLESWTKTAFDPVIIEYNKQVRNKNEW